MKNKKVRISIVINKDQLKSLDEICTLLKTKQRSKAIIFLINYFKKVN